MGTKTPCFFKKPVVCGQHDLNSNTGLHIVLPKMSVEVFQRYETHLMICIQVPLQSFVRNHMGLSFIMVMQGWKTSHVTSDLFAKETCSSSKTKPHETSWWSWLHHISPPQTYIECKVKLAWKVKMRYKIQDFCFCFCPAPMSQKKPSDSS